MEKIKNIKLPNGEVYELGGSGASYIGQIISLMCTTSYIPDGCLPCNGSEYSKAQFNDLWNSYLTANLLNTCTYAEYEADFATYGQCAKFAIDIDNETFRVPTIKDGAVIQQAMSDDELGKAYNAGLPNITGTLRDAISQGGLGWTGTGALQGYLNDIGNYPDASGKGTYNDSFSFDASRSNPIYGNSDTVQMNAVALRYFVVVANGSINESMMDWSEWATSLQSKVSYSDLVEVGQGGTGFYKLSNGLIVQWGSLSISANTSVIVTLPTPFSSTNYMALSSMFGNSASNSEKNWQTSTLTTTSFKAHNGQGGTCTFGWIAVGI